MTGRPALTNREIALLLHLMQRVGLSGRMSLPPARRVHVVALWRRHLIEVWYRCVPDEGNSNGPYFNLTVDGYQLAASLQASRDDRRQQNQRTHTRRRIAA
jgi:hypothetical protein